MTARIVMPLLAMILIATACQTTASEPENVSTTGAIENTTLPSPTTAAPTSGSDSETARSPIPQTTPPAIDPLTGRWVQTNLGLDGLLVIPLGLIWDGKHFYILQRVAFGDMRVWRSVDALAWEELPSLGTFTMAEGGPITLLSHGDWLIAAGRHGEEATVWIYEGESPWREVPLGESLGESRGISSLAVAGPNLVAFGSSVDATEPIVERHAKIWVSGSGDTWTEVGSGLFEDFSRAIAVVPLGDGVVALANQSTIDADGRYLKLAPLLVTSTDGVEWETLDFDLGEQTFNAVTGGEQLRLFSRSSIYQSDDGESWTRLPIDVSGIADDVITHAVGLFNGHLVATGGALGDDDHFGPIEFPAAWTYAGGGEWHELGSLDTFTVPGLIGGGISGGDRFVANGNTATEGSPNDGWALYTFVIELPVEDVLLSWVNQTGLGQVDPIVWTRRLDRACAEGVWHDDIARQLANEFIAEDLPLTLRDDGAVPNSGEAAQALWIMAVNYCRADFPAGEIADGAPTP